MWKAIFLGVAALAPALADVSGCACDTANTESMQVRRCSLCGVAEHQPSEAEFFFLKDNNPHKPNRWLLLPRSHRQDGPGTLESMSPAQRARFWRAAVARAKELWGDEWGLALNGDRIRTQCHGHIHIGRLLKGVELDRGFIVVDRPEQIPVPKDGGGMWVHQVGGKLHVHLGEQTCETVLAR